MPKVAVMTDTVACIPTDLARELAIKVVPAANIMFDGKTYVENETITAAEAYELIKKDPDKFVTSAITPARLLEDYRQVAAAADEILFITLAGALSAVNKTARTAAELFKQEAPDKTIRVLDSRAVASTQGLVVLAAARAAAAGKSLDEVADTATKVRQKTGGLMLLDSLRYIYRTGRMSKTAARLVSLLNIRPINRLTPEGTIEMADRTRRRMEGLEKLLALIAREAGTRDLHFMLVHASAPEMAEGFADRLRQEFNVLSLVVSDYSPVMGYGSGPGAIFAGFHPELGLSG